MWATGASPKDGRSRLEVDGQLVLPAPMLARKKNGAPGPEPVSGRLESARDLKRSLETRQSAQPDVSPNFGAQGSGVEDPIVSRVDSWVAAESRGSIGGGPPDRLEDFLANTGSGCPKSQSKSERSAPLPGHLRDQFCNHPICPMSRTYRPRCGKARLCAGAPARARRHRRRSHREAKAPRTLGVSGVVTCRTMGASGRQVLNCWASRRLRSQATRDLKCGALCCQCCQRHHTSSISERCEANVGHGSRVSDPTPHAPIASRPSKRTYGGASRCW